MSALDNFLLNKHIQKLKEKLALEIARENNALKDKYAFANKNECNRYYTYAEKKAFEADFNERSIGEHLICSLSLFMQGDYVSAKEYVDNTKLIITSRNNSYTNIKPYFFDALLAEIYLKKEDWEQALQSVKKVIEADAYYNKEYLLSVRVLIHQDDKNLISLLESFDRSISGNCYLGQLYYKEKEYTKVNSLLQDYHRSSVSFPDDKIYAYIAGLAIIASAKSNLQGLNFVDQTSFWMKALKERNIDLTSCTDLSLEEHNYIKAIKILSDSILTIEDAIMKISCEHSTEIKDTDSIMAKQHHALSDLKDSIKKNLPILLRDEDKNDNTKNILIESLAQASAVFAEESQIGKILKNIALAFGLLGIGYVVAGCVNLYKTNGRHFAFFTNNDLRTVEKIADVIEASERLAP